MAELIRTSIRVKEYENGNPYIMLEQHAPPEGGAAEAMRPFAFDLKPGTTCEQANEVVQAMRSIITHVHFE
ncbi:hypothetical protein [Methylobacterium sp. J-070]|uniref:hypothetical protein n=1 Tax=Methylobacterium sp. J-070 TaxID=2836650 RepID=UPI001FB8D7C5|nr:hypothetical protein [Methylobacterium sp. J-070]MCJ2054221.1 hypothetical protein [Methylobacterium sp. J-070]